MKEALLIIFCIGRAWGLLLWETNRHSSEKQYVPTVTADELYHWGGRPSNLHSARSHYRCCDNITGSPIICTASYTLWTDAFWVQPVCEFLLLWGIKSHTDPPFFKSLKFKSFLSHIIQNCRPFTQKETEKEAIIVKPLLTRVERLIYYNQIDLVSF